MKRFLKSGLSLVLALTIVLSSALVGLSEIDFDGFFAVKAEAASESDLTFALNDDGESYCVTDCNDSASGELVIPSTYNGLPVTSIGDAAFYNCTSLTSVTIPDSVTDIGEYAFSDCTSLTDITIGNSVTSIGDYAFWCCTNLTSITIPDSVTSIGDYAFNGCNSLIAINVDANNENYSSVNGVLFNKDKTVIVQYPAGKADTEYTIPNSVTSIGQSAFESCRSLVSVTIGNSVTSIGSVAFWGCTNLTSITIPDSVTSIGDSTFADCTSLTSITIPNSVTSIGDYAFSGCTSLTSVTIPDSVTSICDYAFYDCSNLTSITIPDSVTSIGEDAFYNCTNLTSVSLPDSVTSIGEDAFYNTAYYNNSSNWVNTVLYIGNHLIEAKETINGGYIIKYGTKTIAGKAFSDCTRLTSVTIPNSVTSIGDSAFEWCESLTSVTIPDSVTSIGDRAFYKCTSLTSVTIPDSVTSVGDYAFYYCTSLFSITIPNSVTSIGDYAFYNCESLTSVTIPDSVTNIGYEAFMYCDSLEYVFYTGSETGWANITIGTGNTRLTELPIHYNATGHTSSDWITDKNATVNAAGAKHKECTVCGEVLEKATIPQLKCAAPKLTKVESTGSGVKVTWSKTAGADSYNIYRKTYSNGKWSGWSAIKSGLSASVTSYTDATAKSGVYYIYTVRAKNEAGLGSFDSTGLKIKFLATPKLSSISNGSGKVTVKWGKVAGASSYTVYRKTYSNGKWSGWSKIGTTKNTYFNDTKVSSGKYYKYTVRATSGDYISYYNTSGLQIKYLAGPKISSASSRRDGILINWNKITGASGYYVYRKTSSGDWKKIATVKGNTKIKYLDETPRKGVTYQYRVKAYSGNSTSTYANTYKIKCKY